MESSWVSVVDTAVKIGLGVLISGAFTYFLERMKQKKEKERFGFEYRLKMLESIAGDIDCYFSALDSFAANASAIAKRREEKGVKSLSLPSFNDNLREQSHALGEARKSKAYASSRLRLIRCNEIADILDSSVNLEREVKDKLIYKKKLLPHDEMEEKRNDIRELKSDLFEKMSSVLGVSDQ